MSINSCPKCGNENIKEGFVRASIAELYMYSKQNKKELKNSKNKLNSQLRKSSTISTEFCSKCGYILGAYVDNPENLD